MKNKKCKYCEFIRKNYRGKDIPSGFKNLTFHLELLPEKQWGENIYCLNVFGKGCTGPDYIRVNYCPICGRKLK